MRTTHLYILPILVSVFLMKNCSNQTTSNTPALSMTEQHTTPSDSTDNEIAALSYSPKMSGLSFVAPPHPFTGSVMNEVKSINADWIATIPYAFTRVGEAAVHFAEFGGHWWGERLEGVRVTIDSAHRAGIKVMLKPQVYVPGGWVGGLDYATDAEWEKWERDYEKYLMSFVNLGVEMNVEAICVGTEFKIRNISCIVSGKIFVLGHIARFPVRIAMYHGKLKKLIRWV